MFVCAIVYAIFRKPVRQTEGNGVVHDLLGESSSKY